MAAPAAVLSILVDAHTGTAMTNLKAVDAQAERSGKSMRKLGTFAKAGGIAAAAGVAVAVVAAKGFVRAAQDSEVSATKMQTQLKALGISYKAHAKQIDKVIQKTSQLSGLDDEDLQDSFTNIVRVTGDVNEALKLNGLAADIARARHISLEAASKAVAKAAGGQAGALGRLGVVVDKGATGQEAIAAAQKKFAGQAEAYGKTAAGAQERFQVAVENLQEALGSKLLPIVADVADALSGFITGMQDGTGAGGKFADVISTAFTTVRDSVGASITAVTGFLADHRAEIQATGDVVKFVVDNVITPAFDAMLAVVQRVLPAIRQMLEGFSTFIGGIVKVIAGVLTLDFQQAWVGVKDIFGGAINIVIGLLRAMTAPFRAAADAAFGGIASAASSAVTEAVGFIGGIPGKILGFVKDMGDAAAKFARPFLDALHDIKDMFAKIVEWIDKLIDRAKSILDAIPSPKSIAQKLDPTGLLGGRGGGNVGPASPVSSVDGFTSTASKFGLMMTSGFRPGDDGWHGKNRARDYSNGYATSQELAFATYMANTYGDKLLELIHTPLGYGIKNGAKVPLSFWGAATNADHYDHVHVALATGGKIRQGGWALVGERGPELAHLPSGSTVYDAGQTAGAMGGATVNIGTIVNQTGEFDADRMANLIAWKIDTA